MPGTTVQISPALPFDSITSGERIRILGKIPEEALGFRVKKVTFYAALRASLSPTDRWTVQLGLLNKYGAFKVKWQRAFTSGLPAGLLPMTLDNPVVYNPGDVVAGRLFSTGDPDGLADPQIIIEIEEP